MGLYIGLVGSQRINATLFSLMFMRVINFAEMTIKAGERAMFRGVMFAVSREKLLKGPQLSHKHHNSVL